MSPRPKQIDPTSRRSRLRLFFATNPGYHRPRDVAKALGDNPQNVANELARMAKSGDVDSKRHTPEGWKVPLTTYGQMPHVSGEVSP